MCNFVNLTKEETWAIKSLKTDKTIKILAADKGNATVILNKEIYDRKIEEVLRKGTYSKLKKDPTASTERKVYKLLKEHRKYLDDTTRSRLTPHNSKPPHLYGLPKIHKEGMPLRPIISSRGSPCYNLARFLLPIISPLTGKSDTFIKNPKHFIDVITAIQLDPEDQLISFDVENLFTNVPISETLEEVERRLQEDQELTNRTSLPIQTIVELLECCLKSTYFQSKDEFFQQTDGLPMGSPLSPVIANIYMEHFEESALRTARTKPRKWVRYVDDTFIIWKHNNADLEEFFNHINNINPNIKFTMEKEDNKRLPFLDVLVERCDNSIKTNVYRKPTHTGRYLNYLSNHAEITKIGVANTLLDRARTHCNTKQGYEAEIREISNTLKNNGYAEKTIKEIIKKNQQGRTKPAETAEKKHDLYIPYIKGISDKIKRIGSKFNITTRFQTTTTLRNILATTKPTRTAKPQTGIYQIDCQCGKSYIGETKRTLETRIKEHKRHTQRGETTKSGLADHAWEHQHHIQWDGARIIMQERHWYKRKFKEAAIMMKNRDEVFSQPSVEIRPIWKKYITNNPALNIKKEDPPQTNPSALAQSTVTPPDPHNTTVTHEHTHNTLDRTATHEHTHNTRYKARSLQNSQ